MLNETALLTATLLAIRWFTQVMWVSQISEGYLKSFVFYRLKLAPIAKYFYCDRQVSLIFFRAHVELLPLRWRSHHSNYLALGKRCPVCVRSEEAISHYINLCENLPRNVAFDLTIKENYTHYSCNDDLSSSLDVQQAPFQEKPTVLNLRVLLNSGY